MKTPTEIIHDGKALAASVTASVVAALVIFVPFCAWLSTVAPEQYRARIAGVGTLAAGALVALRTAYAWLDKSNTSFGRVDGPPPPPPGGDDEEIPPVDEADLEDGLDDTEEVGEDEFDEAVDLGVDAPPVD